MTELTIDALAYKESAWKYALLAIAIFILLGLDVLSVLVGVMIDGRSMAEIGISFKHWYAATAALLCSITLWSISATLIVRWARRRLVYDVLFGKQNGMQIFLVSILGIFVLTLISWNESGSFSPSLVREYLGFERRNPGFGVLLTTFQFFYYFLETVMVVLMLACWQRAGELWTGFPKIPWGGLGVSLTWGLAHYASHPEGALTVLLSAFVFGIVFVAVQKNATASVVVVYSAFLI